MPLSRAVPLAERRRLTARTWNALVPFLPWLLLILTLGFLVFRHFILIFTVAASVSLLLAPLQRRLMRAFGGRPSLAAGVLVVLCILLILLPVLSYGALMRTQVVSFLEWLRPNLEPAALQQIWREALPARFPLLAAWLNPGRDANVMVVASEALSRVASTANQAAQGFLARLAAAMLDAVLFLMMVFFLLRDGSVLRAELRSISPLSDSQEAEIVEHLTRTVTGVLQAMLVVPLVQGCLAFVGFVLFGVPAPLLWSVAVVFAAIIPLLGSPLGWVPAAMFLMVSGSTAKGIGLLVYGTLVISMADNVVKPLILRGAAQIHTLLGFLSILGGLYAFGPMGLVAGPVVLSLLLSALRIYRDDVLRWARQPEPQGVATSGLGAEDSIGSA